MMKKLIHKETSMTLKPPWQEPARPCLNQTGFDGIRGLGFSAGKPPAHRTHPQSTNCKINSMLVCVCERPVLGKRNYCRMLSSLYEAGLFYTAILFHTKVSDRRPLRHLSLQLFLCSLFCVSRCSPIQHMTGLQLSLDELDLHP